MKTTTIYIRSVPLDLARSVKSKAAAEGKTLREVVIQLVKDWTDRY